MLSLKNVSTNRQLATLLGVRYERHLLWHAYLCADDQKYGEFDLPKKGGGVRKIRFPITHLKTLQRKLIPELEKIAVLKKSAHGYIKNKSIITNAEVHSKSKFILNLDLEDFFGTINFGRVRGMLIASPYNLVPRVATTIARIVCHENALPQGAPTSPIISNMICAKLDAELSRLARSNACLYTRYSDDITFSTNRSSFPSAVLSRLAAQRPDVEQLGDTLRDLISANGFEINAQKIRFLRKSERQVVTGLVINEKVNVPRSYIRELRAMFHDWEVLGERKALKKHLEIHSRLKYPSKRQVQFREIVRGKLIFLRQVRGEDDVYRRYALQFNQLCDDSALRLRIKGSDAAWESSVWVIEQENGTNQGTAFLLANVGVVTAAHVIDGDMIAYDPLNPTKHYPIHVLRYCAHRDLAVVEVVGANLVPLEIYKGIPPGYGKSIKLLGYPNHAPGKSISVKSGGIEANIIRHAVRHYAVSTPIVTGNSGGPIIDSETSRVLGVAVRGVSSAKSAADTDEHLAVQIQEVFGIGDA